MTKLINIRGTNGSGKSEVIRGFLDLSKGTQNEGAGDLAPALIDLHHFTYATKANPEKPGVVEGYAVPAERVIIVGTYGTQAGGMDRIKSFDHAFAAIRRAAQLAEVWANGAVLFEGIVCSTVFGSWADFDREMEAEGHEYHWCYLSTPLKTCLDRIQARNGGKPIKEDLVAAKVKAIKATRTKAIFARRRVFDLPATEGIEGGKTDAARAVRAIIEGEGDQYAAH